MSYSKAASVFDDGRTRRLGSVTTSNWANWDGAGGVNGSSRRGVRRDGD